MPTYDYKREDGSTFEIQQRITEDALSVCPTTGQKVKRLISRGAGLVFKGTGFYETDYVRNKKGSPDEKTGGDAAEKTASAESSPDKGSSSSEKSNNGSASKSSESSTPKQKGD